MAGRMSRGFALLRASWDVLKLDKELMVFPILSFLACLAVLVVMATSPSNTSAMSCRQKRLLAPPPVSRISAAPVAPPSSRIRSSESRKP